METRDMVRMANQIADFFKGYGEEAAKKEIAAHFNNYWEPRMRGLLLTHIDGGGAGLHDLVKSAAPLIRRPAKTAA